MGMSGEILLQSLIDDSCLQEGLSLIYVICVCLRIVVSNTYCAEFLFCLFLYCVPYAASFSGLSFVMAPSIFSDQITTTQVLIALHFNCHMKSLIFFKILLNVIKK
jgi:hypothetical protein